jgi:hypothetical protein
MNKPMKLRGRIYLENDRTLTFHSMSYDEHPFDMPVDQFDVELNEGFTPKNRWVDGWLFVQQEAQQGSVVYLTLPKPTIAHGKQITVRDLQLMPRYSSIDDFKKKIVGQKLPAMGTPETPVVEPVVEDVVEIVPDDIDDVLQLDE